MSRDLHLVVEIKLQHASEWQPYTVMPCHMRQRDVFNYLMKNPKGLPRDICRVTQLLVDQDLDYHHKSWFDLKEMIEFQKVFRTSWEGMPGWAYFMPYLFGYTARDMLSDERRIPSEVTDVRAVYWFDN